MAIIDTQSSNSAYERSARRDIRIWGLFLVGICFFWAGSVLNPAENCNSQGECAPWLVPIAQWMGAAFALAGAGALAANPRRGSKIDVLTGELVWWQNRIGPKSGDGGRIHPLNISRIRIESQNDADDLVSLYNLKNERQPYFDAEVIPWPYAAWAERLTRQWPHIKVELID